MTSSQSEPRAPSGAGANPPTNRLAGETSPYLLQHAHNPVDWYPWGEEALARARREDRPIFLSIGYSACHWCHVMERESFESPEIAAQMNAHFVNIKVDREERPDLDQIYMAAVQAITGHGGWPMSVFLTPELEPFFGGTYFPPHDARGMAGFPRVLASVERAWNERRDEIRASASEMARHLRAFESLPQHEGPLNVGMLDRAARVLLGQLDPVHGGFGRAPKFPHAMDLKVLLRHHARTGDSGALAAVRLTLEKMDRGGIYDHLGGGFARYSTDDRWLVPHFEKMLYDNALLASVHLEAFQATGDADFARVARETLDYLLGRMADPEGAIHATEDADSEGVEGKYYVWSLDEVQQVLGANRAKTFALVYDVIEQGNWEGTNILNLPRSFEETARRLGREEGALRAEMDACRADLLAARSRRVPPGKDAKVLVSWNGLAIAALAEAGRVLKDERYLDAARRASAFILDRMRDQDGRLLHTYKDGRARLAGYLDDYAHLIDGLTRLYEATGESRWIVAALELSEILLKDFEDAEQGGFYFTGHHHETLIARLKDHADNAVPSGNAMAATALVRLGALTGRADLTDAGRRALESVAILLDREPMACGQSLIALDFLLGEIRQVAVVAGSSAEELRAALEAIAGPFAPHKVVAPARTEDVETLKERLPLLADRPARDGRATTYICRNFTCGAPIVGTDGVAAALVERESGR